MSGRDFWSRRLAAVEEERAVDARAQDTLAAAETEAARATEEAEKSDAELLAEFGLPDPDTLGAGDDFRAFMAQAVPQRLRDRALRRLWVSNPVLANVDGLLDYGEDFTDAAKVVENLQSAYQVGKGMTAHVERLAREAQEKLLQFSGDETGEAGEALRTAVPAASGSSVRRPQPRDTSPLAYRASQARGVVPDQDEGLPQDGTRCAKTEVCGPAAMQGSPAPTGSCAEGHFAADASAADDMLPTAPRRMRFSFAPQPAESAAPTGAEVGSQMGNCTAVQATVQADVQSGGSARDARLSGTGR